MSELLGAVVAKAAVAPPERLAAALKVLQGESLTPPPPTPERFRTLKECADQLGVSACSLWRWQVPGHKLGGRRKSRMSEVEAYLQSPEFQRRAEELREEEKERRGAGGRKEPT